VVGCGTGYKRWLYKSGCYLRIPAGNVTSSVSVPAWLGTVPLISGSNCVLRAVTVAR
jgi:hypothetical protein